MEIFESFDTQIDDLLTRICEKLQITSTQQEQAETRYRAVGEWLSKEKTILAGASPKIYPQGSLRIGTTVKPFKRQEFDLDLVCEFNLDWNRLHPISILDAIEYRLKENQIYSPLIERMNRCIRLNYSNEFHMDILPACPDYFKNNGCVKIPDRKAVEWKDGNPKGFTLWFDNRAKLVEAITTKDIEPLPGFELPAMKPPLKRVVQLLKRYRDIYFQKNPEQAPISIILTTLAALFYRGQASLNESISTIIQGIVRNISNNADILVVLNPTNYNENFTEKWEKDPVLYVKFIDWIENIDTLWQKINNTTGIHNVAAILKDMFGEALTDIALKEQAQFVEALRKRNSLHASINTGTILTCSSNLRRIPIKQNTFYGE